MLQDTKVNSIGKYKTSLTFNGHFLKQFYTYREKKQSHRYKNQRGSSYFWLPAHFGWEQHSIIIHDN